MTPADEPSGGERDARDSSPQLREGDALDLELAGGESLACRILGFDGEDVVLLVDPGLTPSGARAAAPGSRGFAMFERDGQLHAQRGVVRVTGEPDQIALRITGTFRVGHRRAHTRAPLALDIERRPLDAAGAPAGAVLHERTLDLSAGGARVAPAAPAQVGDGAVLVVRMPEGAPIGPVTATVVRAEPSSLGLRFDGLEPDAHARLALLVLGWHRDRLQALEPS